MNNPFGIPDEMFTVMVEAIVKSQQDKQTATVKKAPVVKDMGEMQRKSAKLMKQQMDAYIEAGFTATQAFELVKALVGRKN